MSALTVIPALLFGALECLGTLHCVSPNGRVSSAAMVLLQTSNNSTLTSCPSSIMSRLGFSVLQSHLSARLTILHRQRLITLTRVNAGYAAVKGWILSKLGNTIPKVCISTRPASLNSPSSLLEDNVIPPLSFFPHLVCES